MIKLLNKIGEGETSEVFRIDNNRVVKLYRDEEFAQDNENEYLNAKSIGDKTSLAPRVFETVRMLDREGYIMEEVKGRLFQEEIDNNPERLHEYARELGRAHRDLHNLDFIQKLNNLPQIKRDYPKFLRPISELNEEVISWLKGLFEKLPDTLSLLHSDFMPYNIIKREGGLVVIDWAEPSWGPALMDVARTINYILDPTDFEESLYTINSREFINSYLEEYAGDDDLNGELLHTCLLLNAAFKYSWAVFSKNEDSYSERLKSFILNNYKELGSDRLIEV